MFVRTTRDFIERHGLLRGTGDRVLSAVSGGADSVAMLLALADSELPLVVCHVNHHLRAQASDDDELFVRELAARIGVPVHVSHVDVRSRMERAGESLEMAARFLRHEALRNAASAHGCTAIALAHTSDDRNETVLLNLLRGTGVRGLAAMPQRGESGLIRPILWATRADVLAFLGERHAAHREDETNAEFDALRNRIRHEVMPAFRAVGGEAGLARAREVALLDAAALEFLADAWLDGAEEDGQAMRISLDALRMAPDGALHVLVRRVSERVGGTLHGLSLAQVDEVVRLLRGARLHAEVALPVGVVWRIGRGQAVVLSVHQSRMPQQSAWAPVDLTVPGATNLAEIGLVVEAKAAPPPPGVAQSRSCLTAVFDADGCGSGILFRPVAGGDRIAPLGMGGRRKKLSALFCEKHVPLESRRVYPLLVNGHGEALWAPGLAVAESTRVTADTRRVIILCCAVLGEVVSDWDRA